MTSLMIAVDIGGSNLRVASFADTEEIVDESRDITPHGRGSQALVDALVGLINSVIAAGRDISGICVAVPAPVDPKTGDIREASNLPELVGLPLQRLLAARFSAPVTVRNDAALATLGEYRFGAGRGTQNMAYLTISTGIGGGLILDGRLVSGAGGYAGEVGELLVPQMSGNPMTPVSLETLASGNAIKAAAIGALDDGEESILRETRSANADAFSSRTIADAARRGDLLALRIMHTAATYIGFGIVNVLHLVNPERVVLGGGVMKSADIMMPAITKTVDRFAMKSSLRNFTIVPGELGDEAGLFGGAAFLTEGEWRIQN